MRPTRLIPILLSTCIAFSTSGQADVLVVGPNAAYTTIQSAVDAASDGDIIRCHSGQYQGFAVSGKALTILGLDPVTPPVITSEVSISGITVDQAVWLADLSLVGQVWWVDPPVIDIENCDGPIRLDGIEVHNPIQITDNQDFPALDIRNCSNVSVRRSRFTGLIGAEGVMANGRPGGHAVRVHSSKVAMSECYMEGGEGGTVAYCCNWLGGRGGRGLSVLDVSEVFLARCAPIAGQGGTDFWGSTITGPAGRGIFAIGPNAIVRSRGGVAFTSGGTPPILYTGKQPTLEMISYQQEGSPLAVRITGPPGARVGLYFGSELAYNDSAIFGGPLLVATPSFPMSGAWRFLGTLPATGAWTGTFPTSELPLLTHTTFHMVAVTATGTDRFYSNSASTVLVDSAW